MNDFHNACKIGDIEKIKLIIDNYYSNISFGFFDKALQYACQGGNIDIINLIITYNGWYNNWNSGLYGACLGGHLNIVKLMIDKGANDWKFGLRCAFSGNHFDIIKLMIDKLNDTNIRNNFNKKLKLINNINKNITQNLNNYLVNDLSNLINKFYL